MFNKLVIVCFITLFVFSCSNKKGKTAALPKKEVNKIAQTLYLSDPTFSKNILEGKFKDECSLLPILKKSIVESSSAYSINILSSENMTSDLYELKVQYVEVIPHKWVFMSLRPSSNATIEASIIKNGVTLHTTKKLIGSGVAFGACDRLEKISLAQGRYLAKWLSNYI